MTVIAFRPRRSTAPDAAPEVPVPLLGTFRSPSGRMGRMEGSLRVQRLVIVPRGAFVKGVFTGRLLDADGSLVGMDSRRASIGADLVREGHGYAPVVRPFQLALMGIVVEVEEATLSCPIVLPWCATDSDMRWSRMTAGEQVTGPT
jgi:hypothetical protein